MSAVPPGQSGYLLSGPQGEWERLRLQSLCWEPAGRELLRALAPPREQPRAVDFGCGVLGWLRLLSGWAGAEGLVLGTDIDPVLLGQARRLIAEEALHNVAVTEDDLFNSRLEAGSADLAHARFQLAPLGRAAEQLAAYRRVLRPGGWLVLEEPDASSWSYTGGAVRALPRLIRLIQAAFTRAGGDFNAGCGLANLLAGAGLEARSRTHVLELPAGHPYLRLPVQFARSLRPRLEAEIGAAEFEALVAEAEQELDRPGLSGRSFTLVQVWARA